MNDLAKAIEAARRLIQRRAEAVAWDRANRLVSLDDGDAIIVARALLALTEPADEELKRLAGLCERATPGAWRAGAWAYVICGEDPNYRIVAHCIDNREAVPNTEQGHADAEFIAAAHTAVPALIASFAAMKAEIAGDNETIDSIEAEGRDAVIAMTKRAEAAEAALAKARTVIVDALKAYDEGVLKFDSQEIDLGDPDIRPHPWHEEWLYHAHAALAGG